MAASGKTATLTMRLVDGVTGPARGIVGALGGVNRAAHALTGITMAPGRIMADGIARAARDVQRLQIAGAGAAVGISAAASSIVTQQQKLNEIVAAGNFSMADRSEFYRDAIALNFRYSGSLANVLDAQRELARSGINAAGIKAGTASILSLGQATGETGVDAARAIVTTAAALGLATKEFERVADRYATALDNTAGLTLGDFEVSGKYFNPVARATALSPDEAMAMQVELGKRGIFGSSAGTGLRAAPAALLAPTEKARAAFGRLGIDPADYRGARSGDVTAEQILGVLDARGATTDGLEPAIAAIVAMRAKDSEKVRMIVRDLGEQLGMLTAEDRNELTASLTTAFAGGAARADVPSFLAALKSKGAGYADFDAIFGRNHGSKMLGFDPVEYEKQLGNQRGGTGAAQRKAGQMVEGLPGDVNKAAGAIQALVAAASNAGAVSDMARSLQAFAEGVTRLADANPAMIRFGTHAAVALAAMAPLGLAIGGVGAAASLALNPVTLVGAALAGIVALNIEPISNGLRTFANAIGRAIDPAIVSGIRDQAQGLREWASSARLGRLGLNRFADGLGIGLADGINRAVAILPGLRELGAAVLDFGRTSLAGALPAIDAGVASLRSFSESMVGTKIQAIRNLASAWADFGARVLPTFTPAAAAGLDLVAVSFNTLAAGAEAVGRVIGAATEGLVSFGIGFLKGIDTPAMQSTADGLAAVFRTIGGAVTTLGDGFRSVSSGITGASTAINSFAAGAGAGLSNAFNTIAATIRPIVNTIVGIFNSIGTAVDGVMSAFSRLSGATVTIPSLGGAAAAINPGGGARNAGAAIGAMVGPAPLPGKAAGGAVRRGLTYEINERGRETVTMGTNGYVTPAHRMNEGGGKTVHNYYITGANAEDIGRQIEKKWARRSRRAEQTGMNR